MHASSNIALLLQLQISPPTSSRRRNGERRDPFADDDEEQEQDISSNDGAHSSINDAFLPPVDASSTVTTLFGTSKNEEMRLLEQLYASQIAAILFARAKQPQDNADEEGTSVQGLREAKPVVVALGFKPAFLEVASMEEQRTRFKEVMELVHRAI